MQKHSNGYHYAAVSAWTEASNEGAGCEIWHERDTSEAGFESPDELAGSRKLYKAGDTGEKYQ